MSASLLVDLGQTTYQGVSIQDTPLLSGSFVATGSGAFVGQPLDLLHMDTFCNLFACGVTHSGQLRLAVQTAPDTNSGSFTDPTSGLAALPTSFQSGGILWINSGGLLNGILGAVVSGQNVLSGWFAAAGFQRPHRYARVVALAEATSQYAGSLTAGFISQLRTIGSGGGFTFSPTSGVVNV